MFTFLYQFIWRQSNFGRVGWCDGNLDGREIVTSLQFDCKMTHIIFIAQEGTLKS